MAINFYSSISLNKNELQNAVVQNAGSDPGSPAAGQIYYNSGDNTLRVYNGSSFQTLSTGAGDITGVTAGTGLTGGGSSGDVTLNVIGGDGITANANDIAITAAQTTVTSVLNTSLVVGRDADNQIKFATDNQIIFRVGAGDNVIFKASGEIEATKFDGALEGNADTATALATARAINGVNFDGTGDITITAAGSTLSDTVTVAKGGTGTTSYTDNQIVAYNSGTGKLEGHNFFLEQPGSNAYNLVIGDGSTTSSQLSSENGAPLTMVVDLSSGANTAGSDLTLTAGRSTGTAEGGDIVFKSSPSGSSGSIPNSAAEIAKLDNLGNLQLDGGITTGSTSFVNSSGLIQVANQSNITGVGTISSGTWNGTAIASAYLDADTAHLSTTQTFTGAKTFTGTLALTGTGRITGIDTVSASTDAASKGYVDALHRDDVSNVNLLTRLANLESTSGAANENIVIGTDSGDTIVITGNLQVSGTTTTVDSTTVNIGDHNIVLDTDNSTSAVVDGAGITLEGGSGDDVTWMWSASNTRLEAKLGSSLTSIAASTFVGNLTGTADVAGTAGRATDVTVTANNSTNETVYLTFVDGATGGQGIETDTALKYNPSTNIVTAGTFQGDVTGDVTGNADTATALATSRNLQVDLTSTSAQGFTGAANATSIGVSGELPTANTAAKVTSIVAGAGIDVSGATGDVTVTAETASASNAGVVELATSAETQTGTDTGRAVTPDGLAARSVVADIDVSSLTDANIVTITHNLGTADIMVQVYDKTTEANIMCDIARTTDDFATASTSVVSIDFGTAPPNDCRALITSLKGATASGTVAYT